MSKIICANCGKQLSCGCQKRVASNGKNCCKGCLATYENQLKLIKEKQTNTPE